MTNITNNNINYQYHTVMIYKNGNITYMIKWKTEYKLLKLSRT